MKHILISGVVALMALAVVSCSGLSGDAKKMVGDYYSAGVSANIPYMELNGNGSCVLRGFKTEENVVSCPGRWNVEDDSLKMWLKPEKVEIKGDSSLVGNIPSYIAKKIVEYDGMNLTVNQGGINYTYARRGQAMEKEVQKKQEEQAREGE